MSFLVDTDVLVRRVDRKHPEQILARRALDTLKRRGERICVAVQNLYELWVVSTRPVNSRGLGLTPMQVNAILARIERSATVLRDPEILFDEWRRTVVARNVSGRQAHDARLVAAMRLHGISAILTFNGPDFRRYTDIEAIHPSQIVGSL